MLKGSCNRCTHCCTGIQVVMAGGQTMKEWALARGFEVLQEAGPYIETRIEIPCPHLKDGLCDIHDNKPDVCKQFPEGMPEFLMSKGLDFNISAGPQCGFRFES